jgi:hypothetical protein
VLNTNHNQWRNAAMHFVDDEFLLLSRGGRFSPGTHERLARALATQDARRELAASKKGKQSRPPKTVRAKVAAPVRAMFGGARGRTFRGAGR